MPEGMGAGAAEKTDESSSVPAMAQAQYDTAQAAAKMALDHPEMVDRLELDDSAGLTFQPSFARDAFVPTDPAGLDRLFALLTPKPPKLPDFAVRATLHKIARDGNIIQQSMDSMEGGADLLDARLGDIKQPTLVVWGTEDKLIPIAVGQTMHRNIPNSVFLGIVGCGHLAPGECPRPVLAGTACAATVLQ